MKNKMNFKDDSDFERHLKEKMEGLSSSVDCFDKISARVFPENDTDFSDSEFTVSDTENVTGKRRIVPVFKWAAAAAAVVLCVGILPKATPVQKFLTNFAQSGEKKYRSLVAEILSETEKNEYITCDMTLDEYISNDILVAPLYSCPFGRREADDVRVRLYIRSYNSMPTNQIYAVEYAGEFGENNFLAAAETTAEFSEEDFNSLDDYGRWECPDKVFDAVKANFRTYNRPNLSDLDGKASAVASYSFNHIFKDSSGIRCLQSQVIYGNTNDDETGFYDICTLEADTENPAEALTAELDADYLQWDISLNYDGTSALPPENGSHYVKRELFDKELPEDEAFITFYNFSDSYGLTSIDSLNSMEIKEYGKLTLPVSAASPNTVRVYFSDVFFMLSSDTNKSLSVTVTQAETKNTFQLRRDDMISTIENETIIPNDYEQSENDRQKTVSRD